MRQAVAIVLILAFLLMFAALTGCAPIMATEERVESVIYHATHPRRAPITIWEQTP